MSKDEWLEAALEKAPAPSAKTKATLADLLPVPGPGQFNVRWGTKCSECGDFIPKGQIAGYNDDEIVCEECHE